LTLHPSHVQASIILADLLLAQKKYNAAVKILDDVLQIGKREPEILLMLVKVYKENGQQEEALTLLNEIITMQGSSEELKEVKNLGETLRLYEETINDYEEQFKEQWEKNLRVYKEMSTAPVKENIWAGDAFLFEKSLPVEDDTLPVINIGGLEPVFEIKEEEEQLKLEERDEIIEAGEEKPIKIQVEEPPPFVDLLEGEELYEESPLRDQQRTPPRRKKEKRRRSPPIVSEEEGTDQYEEPERTALHQKKNAREAGKPVEYAIKSEFDKKALNELSNKMTDAISSFGEVMKNSMISSALLAQQLKQTPPSPPVVMFTQPPLTGSRKNGAETPILPPLSYEFGEDEANGEAEGIPRSLDEDEEKEESPELKNEVDATGMTEKEEPDFQEEDLKAERPAGSVEEVEIEEKIETPELELGDEADEEKEILIESEPEDIGEKGETEEKTDPQTPGQREGLHSFVDKVRRNLAEVPGDETDSLSGKKPPILLDYLSNMTNYLPQEIGFHAYENELRMKVESIRNRLARKRGLFERIETDFKPLAPAEANHITQEKLLSTFTFIKNLSSYVPDQKTSELMREKIDSILMKIRRVNSE
jgi:tetratricopeptide (TPR) repeat protein